MKSPLRLAAALLVLCGGVAFCQARSNLRLRAELAAAQVQRDEADRLRRENQRLAAAGLSPSDPEASRADHAAVVRLRGELDDLKRRAREAATAAPPPLRPAALPADAPGLLPAADWADLGRGTPEAAIETALWAAAGGELDALAESLNLTEEEKARAATVIATLPEAERVRYGTPERLIALLAAKDIPLGGVAIEGPAENPPTAGRSDLVAMRLKTMTADGLTKETVLVLQQGADGWRLNVPPAIVDHYLRTLTQPSAAP